MSEVRLESLGQGPHVLLLHGTPTSWDVLRPIAAASDRFTFHLAAMAGYGGTAPAAAPWSLDDQLAAIERALARDGVTELAVVGFSGGAYRALSLALRGNVKVRAVVTLAGLAALSAEEVAGFRGFAAALRQGADLSGVATARFLSPAFAKTHPAACAEVESWLHAADAQSLALELDAFAEARSLVADLARLDVPVTARVGGADVAAPLAHSKEIVGACKHGALQVVDGAGHALLLEDRDATVAAVLAALA